MRRAEYVAYAGLISRMPLVYTRRRSVLVRQERERDADIFDKAASNRIYSV